MKTFHTLIQLFFASAGSRLFIAKFFSILRHLLAHAAGDIADTELATDFAWVSERHTILFHAKLQGRPYNIP